MAGPQGWFSEMAKTSRWRSQTAQPSSGVGITQRSESRVPFIPQVPCYTPQQVACAGIFGEVLDGPFGIESDREYVKLLDEVEYRRGVADSIGLGFELLAERPIVRNVRRKSRKEKVAVAA
jgi:hypothetical protein